MGARIIAGCSVLKEAPARERSRYKVVICQLPDAQEGAQEGAHRYVVWYIDDKDNPTCGRFCKEREAAQSEFERRI